MEGMIRMKRTLALCLCLLLCLASTALAEGAVYGQCRGWLISAGLGEPDYAMATTCPPVEVMVIIACDKNMVTLMDASGSVGWTATDVDLSGLCQGFCTAAASLSAGGDARLTLMYYNAVGQCFYAVGTEQIAALPSQTGL